ncbi:MAG: hypothetical protein KGL35_29935 [Bradyrhizobium sp.]|nr:hypothetical protein [Bradyrhizobium sp.]
MVRRILIELGKWPLWRRVRITWPWHQCPFEAIQIDEEIAILGTAILNSARPTFAVDYLHARGYRIVRSRA